MDYKGFTISRCDDNGIIREVNGVKKATEGLFFQVYADENMEIEIDNFCGAFGIDMENTEGSICKYVMDNIDAHLSEYKSEKVYSMIDIEYKRFVSSVRNSGKFNIIDDDDKISVMGRIHEYLTKHRPITRANIDYLSTIRYPLETICEVYVSIGDNFVDRLDEVIDEIVDKQMYIPDEKM